MNVAIISPEQNAYSETFIRAHKRIDANVFFYFGGAIPTHLEGHGVICSNPGILKFWIRKFFRKLTSETFSVAEIEFIKSLQRNKIDVVLAEYGTTGADLVHICKRIKLPLVTMFHGYDASAKQIIEKYHTRYMALFEYASKIIVVSEEMKKKLESLGCMPNKIIKAIYGPDDRFLNVIPVFSEKKSFISIGRFVDKKAPYYTLLAIKKVADKYPDVLLYFAGEGKLFETCYNLASYFKLEKNVKFLGIITPEEFANYLGKVSGYIQHSVTSLNGDMEGTPVAILEANAAGIPVIATRHAGIPEVIIDGETGFLCEEHDVDQMAEKIITLIEDPELKREMGEKGKENIRSNFSLRKHLDVTEGVLTQAQIRRN